MQKLKLLIVFMLLACTACSASLKLEDRAFFEMPFSRQKQEFLQLDMRRQYDLLMVGNRIVHPPALYMVNLFAKHGGEALPILRVELENADAEIVILNIAAICVEMSRQRTVDWHSQSSFVALLKERVHSMQGQWRVSAQSMILEMGA